MVFLPGDLKKEDFIKQVIRVNHAGEYGAKQIYAGQMAVLKAPEEQELLKHMAEQEEEHLKYFTQKMQELNVRPSIFMPIWHVLGYTLGIGTALLGKNAAMVTTKAVEEIIDEHYKEQLRNPGLDNDLAENIEKFRQEELEHKDVAQKNMTNLSIGHSILYNLVKLGCKISINIAKKF